MEIVKLNRGPAKGKRLTIEDSREVLIIMTPEFDHQSREFWTIEHEYRRSHRRLANGVRIYEWMGKVCG